MAHNPLPLDDTRCPLCRADTENVTHYLFKCDKTSLSPALLIKKKKMK